MKNPYKEQMVDGVVKVEQSVFEKCLKFETVLYQNDSHCSDLWSSQAEDQRGTLFSNRMR